MARYDRLTAQDVDISALGGATVRDIHRTDDYFFVLTATGIYRHPVTSSGVALSVPVSSGHGASRRMTGDRNYLYIAYSKTTGSNVTNYLERRAYDDLSHPTSLGNLALTTDNAWEVYSATTITTHEVTDIATNEFMNHLLVTFASVPLRQGDDQSQAYRLLLGAAFRKQDGAHYSTMLPDERVVGSLTLAQQRGAAIQNNVIWYISSATGEHQLDGFGLTKDYRHLDASLSTSGIFPNPTPNHSIGITTLGGIAWLATVSADSTKLHAIQVSSKLPAQPEQICREVYERDTVSIDDSKNYFLARTWRGLNTIIPWNTHEERWEYDNLHVLNTSHRVRAMSMLGDVIYCWIEDGTDIKIITYDINTNAESAATTAFWWTRAEPATRSKWTNARFISFSMRSSSVAWVFVSDSFRAHRSTAADVTAWMITDRNNNPVVEQTYSTAVGQVGANDGRLFNYAGARGSGVVTNYWVYNNADGTRLCSYDTNTSGIDEISRAGWGAGARARGTLPDFHGYSRPPSGAGADVIFLPRWGDDQIRKQRITTSGTDDYTDDWTNHLYDQPIAPPLAVPRSVELSPRQPIAPPGAAVVIEITFSDAVTGFTLSDIETTAGQLTDFSGSAEAYAVTLHVPSTAVTGDAIEVSIPAGAVSENNSAGITSILVQAVNVSALYYKGEEATGLFYKEKIIQSVIFKEQEVAFHPPPPPPPTAGGASTTANSITISWSASAGALAYQVRIAQGASPGGDWIPASSNTSHTFTGLTASTEYTVQVRAANAGGASSAVSETVRTTS